MMQAPPDKRVRSKVLLWVVVVAIILGVGGFALREKWFTTTATPNNENHNANSTNQTTTKTPEQQTTYQDEEFGFSLQYPSSWTVNKTENGTGESRMVNFIFSAGAKGVTLIAVPTSMEGIVRESVSVVAEKTVTLNGLTATKITAKSAKDGTSLDLIFFHKNATLFVLSGDPDFVEQIGNTFTLAPSTTETK